MHNGLLRHWPLVLVILIFCGTMGFLYWYTVNLVTNHHFVYGLDDAYIHMAMAKNAAVHGVWGVTPYQFTSSSSSLWWTLLLTASYLITGVSQYTPFVLNILACLGIIILSYYILRTYSISSVYIFCVLILIVFVSPLPMLTFFGMEHNLHLFFMILYTFLAARLFSNSNERNPYVFWLLVLTPIIVSTRYESFGIIAIVFFLCALKKEFKLAFSIVILALMPSFLFGIYSYLAGGWVIPTTSIKMRLPTASLLYFLNKMSLEPIILSTFVITGLLVYVQRAEKHVMWERRQIALTVAIGSIFFQILAIPYGWFMRYSAYLIGLNILVLGFCLKEWFEEFVPQHAQKVHVVIAKGLLMITIFIPLADRALINLKNTPAASKNIYDQQFQMSQLVKQFYPQGTIACNDIGAISFFNDEVHILDLAGLANPTIANERLKRLRNQSDEGNPQFFAAEGAQSHVDLIMIYESWFPKDIPSNWIKVAEWETDRQLVVGDTTVAFFAPDASKKEQLIENLKAFAPQLPHDVTQTFTSKLRNSSLNSA